MLFRSDDFSQNCLRRRISAMSNVVFGSGFVIEKSGFIITNCHIVNNKNIILLKFGKRLYPVRSIFCDEALDLALLKTDFEFPALLFHQSAIRLSQSVIALGFPNPLEYGFAIKTTEGTINSLSGYQDTKDHFQISTLTDRGNSGGPLIDEKSGGIVGVLVKQHTKNVKCSYAIKVEIVESFLARCRALSSSIKYTNYRGLRREVIVEEACKSVVQILAYS